MEQSTKKLNTLATSNASKLTKTVVALEKVVSELSNSSSVYEELVTKTELKEIELKDLISSKNSEIKELDSQYKEKQRQKEVDFKVSIKESSEKIVNSVLKEQGKMAVVTEDYNALQNELEKLKSDFDSRLKSEISKSEAISKSRTESSLKEKELEYQAKEAKNIATIESQKERLSMYQTQIDKYEKQIQSDREARVEEAKARGNAVINVPSSSK